ncbi:MAG: hypothetical protein KAR84_07200, partial [Elusimicrobiales bacterium]|nr:hypothetical protein [Elusimicrobiales bacterium]
MLTRLKPNKKQLVGVKLSILSLSDFDTSVIEKFGPDVLIGVDEVGRGPLAGPVVACAA